MPKALFLLACIFSFLGVALGAFGAHALKEKISPEMLQTFEVGVRYQMYHAFALFVVAWALRSWNFSNVDVAGWLFTAGIVLFSGSLYALALTGVRWLGAITPFGGICFLAGWVWLAWGVWKNFQ